VAAKSRFAPFTIRQHRGDSSRSKGYSFGWGFKVFETAIVTYGMLTSFVLSGAERNRRASRANPKMLERVGYVLCGTSAGAAGLLLLAAATGTPVA